MVAFLGQPILYVVVRQFGSKATEKMDLHGRRQAAFTENKCPKLEGQRAMKSKFKTSLDSFDSSAAKAVPRKRPAQMRRREDMAGVFGVYKRLQKAHRTRRVRPCLARTQAAWADSGCSHKLWILLKPKAAFRNHQTKLYKPVTGNMIRAHIFHARWRYLRMPIRWIPHYWQPPGNRHRRPPPPTISARSCITGVFRDLAC